MVRATLAAMWTKEDFGFIFAWALASTAGWVLGWLIVYNITFAIGRSSSGAGDPLFDLAFLFPIFGPIVSGLLMSLSQLFFLRGKVRRVLLWPVLCTIGWLIVTLFISRNIFIAGIGGALIGTLQWLLLRKQFNRSWWWIVINVIISGILILSSGIAIEVLSTTLFLGAANFISVSDWVLLALMGGVYGTISGLTMTAILRRPMGVPQDLATV